MNCVYSDHWFLIAGDTNDIDKGMARHLTLSERQFIIKRYWKNENAADVIRCWEETFETPPPTRLTIYRIRDKFNDTGSVLDAPRSGRPATTCTDENKDLVAASVIEYPCTSTRRRSLELGINRRSLQMMLKDLNYKPYIPRLVHGLIEDDGDRRLQFCEIFVNQCEATPNLLDKIVWSDEAQFKLSGCVNRHNCTYWSSSDNPHWTVEHQLNQPGITAWAGVSSGGIVGPFFFQETVTGPNDLDTLRTDAVPALKHRNDFDELYFQQDGAPAHVARNVRNYLDEVFSNKWIGRRGSIEWPAHSPDLTPMDFAVWGIIKQSVYQRNPRNIVDLTQFIRDAFADLNRKTQLCQNICLSVYSRCKECIEAGLQFEPVR